MKVLGSLLMFGFVALSEPVMAQQISQAGVLNSVSDRFFAESATWAGVITQYASWLFWTLTTISMVWTFGVMALRKADIGEFFAELVRFTVCTDGECADAERIRLLSSRADFIRTSSCAISPEKITNVVLNQ